MSFFCAFLSVFQTTVFLQVPCTNLNFANNKSFCHVTLRDKSAMNYLSTCTPFVRGVLLGHIVNCQVWVFVFATFCVSRHDNGKREAKWAGKCAWLSKDEKNCLIPLGSFAGVWKTRIANSE